MGRSIERAHPEVPAVAAIVAERFAAIRTVTPVALAGSLATSTADPRSDLDLYVYAQATIPVATRAAIAGPDALSRELDNYFWEPGDSWVDAASGLTVDVMYRSPAWIENELDRLLVRHEASIGHSTCLWHNLRASLPLIDADGWFARLQNVADQPYPEPLRRAIVAKNHPLLRRASFSFLHQIADALARRDAVAVHHRLTALLASYFDLLFALNRQPHPGEKRLVPHALALCPLLPANFEQRLTDLLAAAAPTRDDNRLVPLAHDLVDDLDHLLQAEGLI